MSFRGLYRLWSCWGLWVQAQMLTGKVTWGEEILPYAQVRWKDGVGTLSDSNGLFSLPYHPLPQWLYIRFGEVEDSFWVEKDTFGVYAFRAPVSLRPVTIMGKAPERPQFLQANIATDVYGQQALFRAPCCNLSEAFQTNATVDVTTADALMGIRQLRQMGYEPAHTPLFFNNLPLTRGLILPWSLQYIPTPWIESLALTKGVGSVVNGYEGLAGQVQVSLWAPDTQAKRGYADFFANSQGNLEMNSYYQTHSWPQGGALSFLHLSTLPFMDPTLLDHNHDGFWDVPRRAQANFFQRFQKKKPYRFWGWDIQGLYERRIAGQVNFRSPADLWALRAYGAAFDNYVLQSSLRQGWVSRKKPQQGISLLGQVWHYGTEGYAGFQTYRGTHNALWLQLMYQNSWHESVHTLKAGFSFTADAYREAFRSLYTWDTLMKRVEYVPGVYGEYTFSPTRVLAVVGGLRADYHSYWGWQVVPRLHLRWNYAALGSLRFSAGRSWRMPQLMAENFGVLLSSRRWFFLYSSWQNLESAYAYSLHWLHKISWGLWLFTFSAEAMYTSFERMQVSDREAPGRILLYSARGGKGEAYAGEISISWNEQLNLQIAYKNQVVYIPYLSGVRVKPFLPRDRWLWTLSYKTLSQNWQLDLTVNRWGIQRIPSTAENLPAYQRPPTSQVFYVVTPQVLHRKWDWEFYGGIENLLGFRQRNPIIGAEIPFSPYFDASMVWGPIMGAVGYVGIRWRLGE
ncbi:MAG: TonB-dependent receptor plug domain-containing protein [Bacteroidia bacterium]